MSTYNYTDDDERAVGCLVAISESLGIDFMAYANLRAQFIVRREIEFNKGRDIGREIIFRLANVRKVEPKPKPSKKKPSAKPRKKTPKKRAVAKRRYTR